MTGSDTPLQKNKRIGTHQKSVREHLATSLVNAGHYRPWPDDPPAGCLGPETSSVTPADPA